MNKPTVILSFIISIVVILAVIDVILFPYGVFYTNYLFSSEAEPDEIWSFESKSDLHFPHKYSGIVILENNKENDTIYYMPAHYIKEEYIGFIEHINLHKQSLHKLQFYFFFSSTDKKVLWRSYNSTILLDE